MNTERKHQTSGRRSDRDGIRIIEKRDPRSRRTASIAAAVFALMIVAVITLVLNRPSATPDIPKAAATVPADGTRSDASSDGRRTVVSRREPRRPSTAPAQSEAPSVPEDAVRQAAESYPEAPERDADEARRMEDAAQKMLEAARAAGATEGIAAFPPHGTSPMKTGIVVPRNFDLPEGYVRHYQITDDGRRVEPVLMFSPDYEFVDANGQPMDIPEDGIVPPDMAPPGMPVRNLAIPKNPYGPTIRLR
jgi:hypothetical protein